MVFIFLRYFAIYDKLNFIMAEKNLLKNDYGVLNNLHKYTIKLYVTDKETRERLIQALSISERTFYRNINAKIGDSYAFDSCQILTISAILDKDIQSLFTEEAFHLYYTNPMMQTK